MSQQHSDEWRRWSSVLSPVMRLAAHVDDLVQVPGHELPGWLTGIGLPAGWRLASMKGPSVCPSRIAVRVSSPDEGGYGCDTVSVYRFTGTPAMDVVERYGESTLSGLHAERIASRRLVLPASMPGVSAVCATGYFSSGGLPVWGQYCTYVAGSASPGGGLLVEHGLLVDARFLAVLAADVVGLSRAIHAAFLGQASARFA